MIPRVGELLSRAVASILIAVLICVATLFTPTQALVITKRETGIVGVGNGSRDSGKNNTSTVLLPMSISVPASNLILSPILPLDTETKTSEKSTTESVKIFSPNNVKALPTHSSQFTNNTNDALAMGASEIDEHLEIAMAGLRPTVAEKDLERFTKANVNKYNVTQSTQLSTKTDPEPNSGAGVSMAVITPSTGPTTGDKPDQLKELIITTMSTISSTMKNAARALAADSIVKRGGTVISENSTKSQQLILPEGINVWTLAGLKAVSHSNQSSGFINKSSVRSQNVEWDNQNEDGQMKTSRNQDSKSTLLNWTRMITSGELSGDSNKRGQNKFSTTTPTTTIANTTGRVVEQRVTAVLNRPDTKWTLLSEDSSITTRRNIYDKNNKQLNVDTMSVAGSLHPNSASAVTMPTTERNIVTVKSAGEIEKSGGSESLSTLFSTAATALTTSTESTTSTEPTTTTTLPLILPNAISIITTAPSPPAQTTAIYSSDNEMNNNNNSNNKIINTEALHEHERYFSETTTFSISDGTERDSSILITTRTPTNATIANTEILVQTKDITPTIWVNIPTTTDISSSQIGNEVIAGINKNMSDSSEQIKSFENKLVMSHITQSTTATAATLLKTEVHTEIANTSANCGLIESGLEGETHSAPTINISLCDMGKGGVRVNVINKMRKETPDKEAEQTATDNGGNKAPQILMETNDIEVDTLKAAKAVKVPSTNGVGAVKPNKELNSLGESDNLDQRTPQPTQQSTEVSQINERHLTMVSTTTVPTGNIVTTSTMEPLLISLLDDASSTSTAIPPNVLTKLEDIYAIFPTSSTPATTISTTEEASMRIDNGNMNQAVTMTPPASIIVSTTLYSMLPPPIMPGVNLNANPPTEERETDVNVIIAISVSVIGMVALVLLVAFLYLMRRRQKQMSYGQRCRPVSLDAYSLDNVSVLGSVRRKANSAAMAAALRNSKRSYGNAAFDDPSLRHNLLNATELIKFAERRTAIYEEFREVPQIIARVDEVQPGCEDKNRYANVVPLPETRVCLQTQNGDDRSEYINANYVRGPKDSGDYYIACQAPLEMTVADFWRMIWEQRSRVIIQATDLIENGMEKCAEYLPPSVTLDNHTTYGDIQVTLKSRDIKDRYAISIVVLRHLALNVNLELTHYWYKWPESGVPHEETPIIAMLLEARSSLKSYTNDLKEKTTPPSTDTDDIKQNVYGEADDLTRKTVTGNVAIPAIHHEVNGNISVNNLKSPSPKSATSQSLLCVHCSPGTGRTGTIIACDIALRYLETPKRTVDIPQIVYYVRRGRASAVQTKEQYEFIYKVASMYSSKIITLSHDI